MPTVFSPIAVPLALGLGLATHSVVFAFMLGGLALAFASQLRASRLAAFAFVAVSAASHGLLDMLTNGGLGIALW